eukprot:604559-Karenia_brevis.AAC.1
MLGFIPEEGARARGHPSARWRDALDEFATTCPEIAGTNWRACAESRTAWSHIAEMPPDAVMRPNVPSAVGQCIHGPDTCLDEVSCLVYEQPQ